MTNHTLPSIRTAFDGAPIAGPVVLPGDPAWDGARQAWNLAVDQHPEAVVFARDAADVVATVNVARDAGLSVVTQGTGHGAAAYRSLAGSVLIRTTGMQQIRIDGSRCSIGAGVLWGEVAASAGEVGRAGLGGSSPDVGVVGYTLGGGIGWLSRRYGLAANRVRSIDIVTATGAHERVSRERMPEVFWALRGGGGGLGVVTAMEFDLVDDATVIGGTVAWDAADAPAVLGAWSEWTADLDDSVTSIIRFLNLPAMPGVPEPFAGRRVLTLGVAVTGDEGIALRRLAGIRRVSAPFLDTIDTMPTSALCRLHGDPEGPTPGMAHHTLLDGFGVDAIGAFDGIAGSASGSPLVAVEVRHLGGAVARTVDGGGALSHIESPYVLNAVGMAHEPEVAGVSHDWLGRTVDAMAPWADGEYLNFVERPTQSVFGTSTERRLQDVRSALDPTGVFRLRTGVDSRQGSVPAA